jgi:hypothetical protein
MCVFSRRPASCPLSSQVFSAFQTSPRSATSCGYRLDLPLSTRGNAASAGERASVELCLEARTHRFKPVSSFLAFQFVRGWTTYERTAAAALLPCWTSPLGLGYTIEPDRPIGQKQKET